MLFWFFVKKWNRFKQEKIYIEIFESYVKTWKQLFASSHLAEKQILKQWNNESWIDEEYNTSCNSHAVCESDDCWTTYHNSLIVRKSFAWRCSWTTSWNTYIKECSWPLWTIQRWLYKIEFIFRKQNDWNIRTRRQKNLWILIADWILQTMSVRNTMQTWKRPATPWAYRMKLKERRSYRNFIF